MATRCAAAARCGQAGSKAYTLSGHGLILVGWPSDRNLAMKSIKLTSPPYDFEKAFRTAKENGVQILLVLSSPLFAPHSKEIADLAMRYQLPAMFTFRTYVKDGGLMSYGVDTDPLYRRGAAFVAKILRGAKASDLPVEQATNFELTVNLKTAKAAGFTLPTSILVRANEVIE